MVDVGAFHLEGRRPRSIGNAGTDDLSDFRTWFIANRFLEFFDVRPFHAADHAFFFASFVFRLGDFVAAVASLDAMRYLISDARISPRTVLARIARASEFDLTNALAISADAPALLGVGLIRRFGVDGAHHGVFRTVFILAAVGLEVFACLDFYALYTAFRRASLAVFALRVFDLAVNAILNTSPVFGAPLFEIARHFGVSFLAIAARANEIAFARLFDHRSRFGIAVPSRSRVDASFRIGGRAFFGKAFSVVASVQALLDGFFRPRFFVAGHDVLLFIVAYRAFVITAFAFSVFTAAFFDGEFSVRARFQLCAVGITSGRRKIARFVGGFFAFTVLAAAFFDGEFSVRARFQLCAVGITSGRRKIALRLRFRIIIRLIVRAARRESQRNRRQCP